MKCYCLFLILLFAQCQTTNEEEIFDVQDKQSLFPLGWIHVSILIFDYDVYDIHVIHLTIYSDLINGYVFHHTHYLLGVAMIGQKK